MSKFSIHDLLLQLFPKSNREDWAGKASQELKGKNPFETLGWKTKDGLEFFPYYDADDVKSAEYVKNYELPPALNPNGGSRAWQSLPRISVSDCKIANGLALSYLERGVDGLFFDLSNLKSVDVNTLLEGIDWPYCNLSFLVSPATSIVTPLAELIQRKDYDPKSLTGSLFWENTPDDIMTKLQVLPGGLKFHALGIYIESSSPVHEISEALKKAALLMDMLTDQGIDKEIVLRSICLSFAMEADFLVGIAKLKAIRILWYQFALAFGIKTYMPSDVQIHARSERWIDERLQPHSNMLNGTTSSLSAILGGCDSITIMAEDENNVMMSRIALNVSNIFREEAHLNKVADPVAGAYAMDTMVDKIAQAAWKAFQQKMKPS